MNYIYLPNRLFSYISNFWSYAKSLHAAYTKYKVNKQNLIIINYLNLINNKYLLKSIEF